jgi:hypothetical protein
MITPAEKHDRYDALAWQLTAAVSLNARPHFIECRVASPTAPPLRHRSVAKLTGHRSLGGPAEGRLASCLSFCLIRLRPAPFTGGRRGGVRAGHGLWRTVVSAGQHYWKACWGQPLASSNLASSAISDQAIHKVGQAFGLGLQGCLVSFVISLILRISV